MQSLMERLLHYFGFKTIDDMDDEETEEVIEDELDAARARIRELETRLKKVREALDS